MEKFRYTAINEEGKKMTGIMEAANAVALESLFKTRGLYLISSKAVTRQGKRPKRGRVPRAEIMTFSFNMATMLRAGVPLLEGLQDIASDHVNAHFKYILGDISKKVEEGASLATALEAWPNVFGNFYANVIGAGEASGNLENMFDELGGFIEWYDTIVGSVKQAMLYPIMLILALGGMMVLFFTWILPKLIKTLFSAGVETPLPTRILIAISNYFQSFWWLNIIIVLGCIVGYKILQSTPKGKKTIDGVRLKMPILGRLVLILDMSRFAKYLQAMQKAGLGMLETLAILKSVISNSVIAECISTAEEQVLEGNSLSASLKSSGYFPPLVTRMISVGERTGNLEKSMAEVNRFYDREIESTIKRVFAVIEPLIIVVLGVVLTFVLLAVILPMYSAFSGM